MLNYIISGKQKLEGEVLISGSKNSALPIIAASILNGKIVKLYNVPQIEDTKMMIEILTSIGCKVKTQNSKIIIDSSSIKKCEIPDELMRKIRSSVILVGALLARFKKATFSYPGGCDIGTRPIDLHLKGFEKMQIQIHQENGKVNCKTEEIVGDKINLDFPSVGATENLILAYIFAKGTTTIENAAREPEIIDLQEFLNKMGAKVKGAGTSKIEIDGVKELKEVSYNIMPDRIEAGTFLCIGAATRGNIVLKGVEPLHLTPVIEKLEEANCKINIDKNEIEIIGPRRLKAVDIKTMPYPGFPTDMQSIFATTMLLAKGTSVIIENIFENRFRYTQELIRMGAKITVEGRTAIIKGTRKITATKVKVPDLRGGAAMILAGLIANGETEIEDIRYILRGYENIDEKLRKLGAQIEIVEKD